MPRFHLDVWKCLPAPIFFGGARDPQELYRRQRLMVKGAL
jgi:hypothetical protein